MFPIMSNKRFIFHYQKQGETKVRSFRTYGPSLDDAHDFFESKFKNVRVIEVEVQELDERWNA